MIAGSSAFEWQRVFLGATTAATLLLAALLPIAISLAAKLRRVPIELTLAASAVVLIWLVGTVLVAGVGVVIPSPHVFSAIASGLRRWDVLLTTPLPAPSTGTWLVLPFVSLWVSSAAATEVVLRTRFQLLGLVALAGSFGLAVPFGIGAAGSQTPAAAVFVAAAAALAVLASPRLSADREGRRRARAAPTLDPLPIATWASVVAVSVLLLVLVPNIFGTRPYDPRAHRIPPGVQVTAVSPLAELSEWAKDPHQRLLRVSTRDPAPLVLAILTSYNPDIGWVGTDRFLEIGPKISTTASTPGPSKPVVQRIHVEQLPGPWLPAAATPVALTGVTALANAQTGVLVASSGNVDGSTYTVTSDEPISSASCADASAVIDPSATNGIPISLQRFAQKVVSGETTACYQLEELALYLHSTYKLKPDAPSGSSIEAIDTFLNKKTSGGGVGTSEQFAGAFAVLARGLGFDTRVVVGFVPPDRRTGATTVTSGDALAWPEVDFSGAGWFTFDPTPVPGSPSPVPPHNAAPPTTTANTVPSGPPATAAPIAPRTGPHHLITVSPSSTWDTVVAPAVGGPLLLLAIWLILVAALRSRRRQARFLAGAARMRVRGAWLEAVDSLADSGLAVRPSDTTTQLVRRSTPWLDGESSGDLATLGSLVNLALYGPDEPTKGVVDEAWATSDAVRHQVYGTLPLRRRMVRLINPRPSL
jgi:hypothetical protein